MTCHYCRDIEMVKFGFKNGFQRYQCNVCKRTRSNIPENPLVNLRVPFEKAVQVCSLLAEGNGIRSCERLTGLNRRTVLSILRIAGQKAARFMEEHINRVNSEHIQIDELTSFVLTKQQNTNENDDEHGQFFTFLAVAKDSKLIVCWRTAKRTAEDAAEFLNDLKDRVNPGFQLSSDSWSGYCGYEGQVRNVFADSISYATETKYFAKPGRFLPRQVIGLRRRRRIGNPDLTATTTCHVERTNLTVRLFNRRFTRCTLGYSKTLENLRHAVAFFVAHFNFCRIHSAHGQTPAQAAGLVGKAWTIADFLNWKEEN